jgi:hypothetical protein
MGGYGPSAVGGYAQIVEPPPDCIQYPECLITHVLPEAITQVQPEAMPKYVS